MRASLELGSAAAVLCCEGDPEHAAERGVLVLLHGLGGAKEDLLEDMERLAGAGFLVVAFDAPGHGARFSQALMERLDDPLEQDEAFLDAVKGTARDVSLVVDELGDRGWLPEGRAGVVGFSLGGFAALLARVSDPRLDVVVSISGSPAWDLDEEHSPLAHPERFYPAAVLLLNGELDDVVDPLPSRALVTELSRRYGPNAARVQRVSYPDSGHLLTAEDAADAWARVEAFCRRYLRGPSLQVEC